MKKTYVIPAFLAVILAFAACDNPGNGKPGNIAVTGVSLNKTTTSLLVGGTETLTAAITPDNATNKNVTWKSGNTAVASVSKDGVVTGVKAGTATITASTVDGGITASCTVTVSNAAVAVTGISLNKTTTNLVVGGTETLTSAITPSGATNKNVTWISSDPTVATVSAGGVVTGVKAGTTVIIATTVDGGKTAFCTVTVSNASVAVTGVSLNKPSTSLLVTHTETLYAIIEPDTATNQNVTWRSSNTAVATVSGGVVTAVSAGIATITVTTVDGNKTASCAVTVSNAAVPVTGVSLNKTSTGLVVGSTEELIVVIAPTTATNQNITWSSSNTTAATVSAGGLVTAKNVGTTTITVKTDDGNKTASCNITVNPKVITFTVDAISAQTYTGSAITPNIGVKDGSTALTITTDYTVAYTNNINVGIATVTISGTGNYAGSSGGKTFTINKGAGAAVTVPTVSVAPTANSITVNTVSLVTATGQSIEYAISKASDWTGLSTWQTGTSFSGLSIETEYYIYARSIGNSNCETGMPSISTGIMTPLATLWAKTITTGMDGAEFNGVTVDSGGNVYAVGYQWGTGNYNYGSGNIAGVCSENKNPVVVKYNSSGSAQWAKTITAGTAVACFDGVAVDSDGNVYAVGYQWGTGNYNYGSGNIAGPCNSHNPVVVKYNSSGVTQWAKTITAGRDKASFNGVAVDSSGNVYVIGYQLGGGYYYDYGCGNIAGSSGTYNPVVVKYNSSGVAQWAKTITAGKTGSFTGVVVDSDGNIYVVGEQEGNGNYNYGSGNIAGPCNSHNPVVVKYNSSGVTQWAKTITAGTNDARFNGVAVDSGGNVYAVGQQKGTGNYNYGSGNITGTSYYENSVVVKYDSSGTAQWAKTVTAGKDDRGYFNGVAVDSGGNVYAVGYQYGTGNYNYGSGIIKGTSTVQNPVVVKYNSSGVAQWAKTIMAGTNIASFDGVAVDSGGNVYAVGYQYGTGNYNYGSGNIMGTSTDFNPVVVNYGK